MSRTIAAVSAALALAAPAVAQPQAAREIPEYLADRLAPTMAQDGFVGTFAGALRRSDFGGDGLDYRDLQRAERYEEAERRAGNLMLVMRFDLDGDLRVSATEARQMADDAQAGRLSYEGAVAAPDLAGFDANGDGDVTLAEVRRAPAPPWRRDTRQLQEIRALLALPPASDGRLTEAELAAYARDVFALADVNGDKVLDRAEAAAVRTARRHDTDAALAGLNCRLPPLQPGQALVLLGAAEGGGPRAQAPHRRARTVTLRIQSGDAPLYIVAASGGPIRWRLKGDVDRVTRMVALAEEWRDNGVVIDGLDAPFAQARPADGCISAFVDPSGRDATRAIQVTTAALGRAPDAVIGAVSPEVLIVPPPPRR